MKVELTDRGLFTLTAETQQDNNVLFVLINTKHINGVRYSFGKNTQRSVAVEPSDVPAYDPKKHTLVTPADGRKPYLRKKYNSVHLCPVEGCSEKVRSAGLHMRMTHGIDHEGNVHDTFIHARKGETPVAKPVVKLGDGSYKLQKKQGFLD